MPILNGIHQKPYAMKKKYLLYLLLVILFTACTRGSDDLPAPDATVATLNGAWKVSYYWDKKDETSNFSGWSLSFQAGGVATATRGSQVVIGTWSRSSNKFILSFGSDPLLSDLNNDWQVVTFSETSIRLKDDNPLQDDELHLGR